MYTRHPYPTLYPLCSSSFIIFIVVWLGFFCHAMACFASLLALLPVRASATTAAALQRLAAFGGRPSPAELAERHKCRARWAHGVGAGGLGMDGVRAGLWTWARGGWGLGGVEGRGEWALGCGGPSTIFLFHASGP